jgi:hypothetical protein
MEPWHDDLVYQLLLQSVPKIVLSDVLIYFHTMNLIKLLLMYLVPDFRTR